MNLKSSLNTLDAQGAQMCAHSRIYMTFIRLDYKRLKGSNALDYEHRTHPLNDLNEQTKQTGSFAHDTICD